MARTKPVTITYAKVAADLDSNPKIRRAGPLGRDVFEFVLRRNAGRGATGAIPIGDVAIEYMAPLLMIPAADCEAGLDKAIEANLLTVDGEDLVIVGWDDEWARTALSPTERKRNERLRERERQRRTGPSRNVTADVTPEPTRSTDRGLGAMSRDVTGIVTVTDQIRSDQRDQRDQSLARACDLPAPYTGARYPDADTELDAITGPVATSDPAAITRRGIGDRLWDRLVAIRQDLCARRDQPLPPLRPDDIGRRDLAERLREASDRAAQYADHALVVLETEARSGGDLKWLTCFTEKAWKRILDTPRPSSPSTWPSSSSDGSPRRTVTWFDGLDGDDDWYRADVDGKPVAWWPALPGASEDGPAPGEREYTFGEITPAEYFKRREVAS